MADSKKQQQDAAPAAEDTSVEHKFSTYEVVADVPETNPPAGQLVEQQPGKPSGE